MPSLKLRKEALIGDRPGHGGTRIAKGQAARSMEITGRLSIPAFPGVMAGNSRHGNFPPRMTGSFGSFRCSSLGRRGVFAVRSPRGGAARAGCTVVSLRFVDGFARFGCVTPCWFGEGSYAKTQRRKDAKRRGWLERSGSPKSWTTCWMRSEHEGRATGSWLFRRGVSARLKGATERTPCW